MSDKERDYRAGGGPDDEGGSSGAKTGYRLGPIEVDVPMPKVKPAKRAIGKESGDEERPSGED